MSIFSDQDDILKFMAKKPRTGFTLAEILQGVGKDQEIWENRAAMINRLTLLEERHRVEEVERKGAGPTRWRHVKQKKDESALAPGDRGGRKS